MTASGMKSVADLREQVILYFKRPDRVDDIDMLIRKGERRVTRSLRLPIQEAIGSYNLGEIGAAKIPYPLKFLETKILMNSAGKPITIELNHLFFARSRDRQGDYPTHATRVGKDLYFWPTTGDTVTWIYYKILESVLTEPEVENLLLDVAGEAWLHASLTEGGILTRNPVFAETHKALMLDQLSLLAENAHRDQYAGTSIVAQSEYAVD